jgi:long-chain acyl-CoA synthetase
VIRTEMIASIPELLHRHAGARGNKLAFADVRSAVTYGDLMRTTGNLAGSLSGAGVSPGHAAAILLPNSVAWVQSCLAINRAGAIAVPISYDSSPPEIVYRLVDADCRVLITTAAMMDNVERIRSQAPGLTTIICVGAGSTPPGVLRLSDLIADPSPRVSPDPTAIDQPAFILYTSGTTGRAKGVLLSVRGMLWVTAACWVPIAGLSEHDTLLSPLPLFHSYALNLSVLSVLATGASAYLMQKYSTSETLRLLDGGPYTILPGVPTTFHYLLQAAGPKPDLGRLRLCISAGAIMPAALNRAFEAAFRVPLLDGYGITETSTMVTMNWPIGTRVLGSCGLPIPGLAVRIIDPASGADVEADAEGELIVRGPNLMCGYHNKPQESAAALRGGWYHTGDLAKADANGYLAITGRLKELIIRGGQNIAPAEIEEAAGTFEGVLDCAVVGAEHPLLGEVPVIFVVPRSGHAADATKLLAFLRDRLSAYKLPYAVHFIDEIPRTGSGKILRFRLRERLGAQG